MVNFKKALFDPNWPSEIPLGPDERAYVYHDSRIVFAVNVALATRRPLLITGPPGSGKSSLADDVARRLGWALSRETITSRTRIDDLIARFDAVQRLNDAQVGELNRSESAYQVPGVLWWAFSPSTARTAAERVADRRRYPEREDVGTVVLLDEIDKAEPDLPNDLLAPLDTYTIDVPGHEQITAPRACLVIITSNGERTMPPAFLRRCLALELDEEDPEFFVAVATSHFGTRPDRLYRALADRTLTLIGEAESERRRPPSMAEYLDAVRACLAFNERPPGAAGAAASKLWVRIEEAALRKTARPTQPSIRSDDLA